MPIARQRLGKHVSAVNTPQQQRGCFYTARAKTVDMQWNCNHA
jgi:hypothetical protein